MGSAYLRSVFFLKGPYFCSSAGLGRTSGGGGDGAVSGGCGGPAAGGAGVGVPFAGVGGNGEPELAGTNVGGGSGGWDAPGGNGIPGGSIPGGGIIPGGGSGKPWSGGLQKSSR